MAFSNTRYSNSYLINGITVLSLAALSAIGSYLIKLNQATPPANLGPLPITAVTLLTIVSASLLLFGFYRTVTEKRWMIYDAGCGILGILSILILCVTIFDIEISLPKSGDAEAEVIDG